MKSIKSTIAGTVAVITMAGSMVWLSSPAMSADRRCPLYRDSLSYLRQAKDSLQRASNNVRGERLDAINDIDRAIADVRDAMRVKRCN
jgi:hypothetical protein